VRQRWNSTQRAVLRALRQAPRTPRRSVGAVLRASAWNSGATWP